MSRQASRAALFPRGFESIVLSVLLGGTILPAQALYWTAVDEYPTFVLRRSGLDGSGIEDIPVVVEGDLQGLTADARAHLLYWVERDGLASRIVRADLDGRERRVLLETDQFLSRIALDPAGGFIYFTGSRPGGGAGISRMQIDGGSAEPLLEVEAGDIAVDGPGGRLYWVQEGPAGIHGTDIWRSALDGKDAEPVVHHSFEHHTTGIAVDSEGGKLYWGTVDYREGRVQVIERANLDGTGLEPVTTANPGLDDWPVFIDLDLDARKIYWVNGEDGVFHRASVEGGEAEVLHEDPGAFGPFDMVLVPSLLPLRAPFRRGDSDGNGRIELTDPIFTLETLFLGAGTLPCRDAADANDDGGVDLSDAVSTLSHLFLGTFEIPLPGTHECGEDPTEPGAPGCVEYSCGE